MTPVTIMGLICLLMSPRIPRGAADPKRMRHTIAHDIARFRMPVQRYKMFREKYKIS